MKIKYMNKLDAEKIIKENTLTELLTLHKSEGEYAEIVRNKLLIEANNLLIKEFRYTGSPDFKIKDKRKFDLLFGLKLYDYLTNDLMISIKDASNAEFWIYLSVVVIPEIVSIRWEGIAKKRFYETSNRIYLYTLWWYIHLSWQGSIEETQEVLNLVDRTGVDGFRVDLTRVIMKEYSLIDRNIHSSVEREFFRKIMILNTAIPTTTEPALVEGGLDKYVENIFNILGLIKEDGKYR